MKTVKLETKGLNCSSCAQKIEDKLSKESYVEKVIVNFADGSIKITYTNISNTELIKKVSSIVKSIEDGVEVLENNGEVKKDYKFTVKVIRLIIGITLIITMFLTNFSIEFYMKIFTFMLFGYDVIYKALKKIFTKDIFNENFLMSFATISAFAIGEVNEAIGVMLFYQFGEFFQDLAVGKSRSSIESLMNIATEQANLYTDGTISIVESKSLEIDDVIIVKVGEKIPVDGIIIEGKTQLDTSSLTGESVPVSASTGDTILSGVINLNEVIKVRVTKTFDDSTVSKIIELVKDSASHKGETEKFITKFSKIYTPIVLLLALLLVLIPTIINPSSFGIWFERSLIFLVVSCPCALVASIPLTFFSGLGYASKQGILVKGSNYLQAVTNISQIVFDKTGTITEGNFIVTEFKTTIDQNNFFDIVYNTERYSSHPIAKSIVYYIKNNYNYNDFECSIEEIAGMGVKSIVNNDVSYLGNSKLLQSNNITHPEVISNGSCIFVTLNNEYIGHIVVADKIKDESINAITKFKTLGIKTLMLTGDKESEAHYIANKVGVDGYYSELLPHNKVEKLNEICNTSSELTAFVGDGINDAPVLKRSDIGIAMGTIGSDAAIEASDIVIMNDNLDSINKLISIAKNTVKIAKQNIALALIIKGVILILGALGLASMWLAIFADVGVTLIAILNASRKK